MKNHVKSIAVLLMAALPLLGLGQVNLSNGLIAHLPMDLNGSDISGNNDHATVSNAGVQPTSNVQNVPASALYFTGSTGQGMLSFATSLLNNRTAFSMSYWFNLAQLNNGMSLVGQDNILETGYYTGPSRIIVYHPTGSAAVPLTLGTNVWQHLIVTCNGTELKAYLNGVLTTTLTGNYALGSNGTTTRIGGNVVNLAGNSWLRGNIDEVRFYDRVVTSDEITVLATPQHGDISIGAPNSGTYCAGDPLSIGFTAVGEIVTGNEYRLQLSNAAGNFTNPIPVATISGTALTNTFTTVIPTGTPSGAGYRLRVVSTNLNSVSDTTAAFTVNGVLGDIPNPGAYRYAGNLNGKNYYVSLATQSWTTARTTALSNGGQLASIPNQSVNTLFQSNLTNTTGWIGLNDADLEGNYVWSNGENIVYTNWESSEPNNAGGMEHYGEMDPRGRWNDADNPQSVISFMELDPAGTELFVCNGDDIQLTAATLAGATYVWTGPNGFTSNLQNPIISGAGSVNNGTYILTYTLNSCTGSDSVVVTVNQLPLNVGNLASLPVSLSSGLVLHYTMNGTALDVSGNGNTGTLTGGVTATTDRFGIANAALAFNGSNGYIDVPDGVYFNGNDFTVSAWVRMGANNSWSRLFDFGNGNANNNVLTGLSNGTTGRPAAEIYNGATSGGQISSVSTTLPINKWSLLTYSWSNGTGTIYINGSQVIQGLQSAPTSVVRTINYIGRSNWSGDAYANARMDDFRIYNRLLSHSELQALLMEQPENVALTAQPAAICSGNSSVVKLINSQPGVNYQMKQTNNWASVGAVQTGTGDTLSFATGVLTSTTTFTFIATQINSLCSDTLSPGIVVTVNPLPSAPVTIGDSICHEGIFTLQASGAGIGGAYNWYTVSTGGTALVGENGTSFTTPLTDETLNYYVSITDMNGCEGPRAIVTATVLNPLNPPVDLVTGLILHYKFDGNVADSSGNGYNGSISGTSSYVNDRNGNASAALNSTASGSPGNNYISAGNPAKIQQLTNRVSISMWIYQQQSYFGDGVNTGHTPLVNKWNGNGLYMGLIATTPGNPQNRVRWRINGTAVNSNTNVPLLKWTHVVCTYDGATIRIYQNGVQTGSTGYSGTITNNAMNLMIGRQADGNGEITFRGNYDQLRIYNRSLNLSEVQTLYNNESVAFAQSPLCDGEDNLTLTTFNFPGATYQWSGPNGFTSTVQNPPIIANADSATYNGLYTLLVTNYGCTSAPQEVNVVIHEIPQAPLTVNDTVCGSGNAILQANGANSEGIYNWYTVPVGGSPIAGQTGPTLTINNLLATTVRYVSISRFGCEGPRTPVTAVYQNTVATNLTVTGSAICVGTTTATVTIPASESGVDYQAFASGNPVSTVVSGNGAIVLTINTTGFGVGNTTVTIQANRPGCGPVNLTNTATITVNALPLPTITAGGSVNLCTGDVVQLTSSSAVSYLWSDGSTTFDISVGTTGNYTVTVTDANGCIGTSAPVAITVNPIPNPQITDGGPTTFCAGGSVILTASGGTTYLWSNGETTNSITVTQSGTYSVTASNNGCTSTSANTIVNVNPLPQPTITANGALTFCSGGSVELTSSAASSYLWSNSAATQAITVTASGNYSVTVTDGNGCAGTSPTTAVTVNSLPVPVISASGPTTFCAGGSVILNATGGTTYLWSTGETGNSIAVNAAGTYNFIAYNGSCSANSSSITVSVNNLPVPIISANGATEFCQGGSVDLTSSIAASYLWSNGSAAQTITVTQGNSYSVTVTDGNGCSGTSNTITTTVYALPNASFTASQSGFCPGGSTITLTATDNSLSDYDWYFNGNPLQLNGGSTLAVNNPGTYGLTVGNAQGCSASSSLILTTVTPPTVTISAPASSFCSGSAITVSANLVNGAMYQWYLNNQPVGAAILDGNSYLATVAGDYSVTTTTSEGCEVISNTITLTENSLPTVNISTNTTNFCSGGSALLTATASGVTYQWLLNGNPILGATNSTYSAAQAGNYSVVVDNGCTATSNSITITVNNLPGNAGTIFGDADLCAGMSDTYSVTAVNGATSYQWTISPIGAASISQGQGTNSVVVNSTNQNFTLTVTPQNACGSGVSSNETISVTTGFPCQGEVMFAANNTAICVGNQVTYTNYTDNNLFFGTTIHWNFGAGASPATAVGNGPHTVTYSTSGLKTVTLSYEDQFGFTVAEEIKPDYVNVSGAVITSAITGNQSISCASGSETYSVTATAGSSYNWTIPAGAILLSGQGTSVVDVDFNGAGGTVSVIETNSGGCTGAAVTLIVSITNAVNTSVISGPTNVSCATSSENYSVIITAGSTYNWSVPAGAVILSGQGTNSIQVDFNGNFGTVTVVETNSSGCNGAMQQVVVDCTNALDELTINSLNVFPNPTNSSFAIQSETAFSNATLELYDEQGKLVHKQSVSSEEPILIDHLSSGIYNGILLNGDVLFRFKVIKSPH